MSTAVRQFTKDDLRNLDGCDRTEHPFYFTAAMISACAPLFDALDDNHDVEALLRRAKVIRRGCHPDSESCQMFVNFARRSTGEKFIERLNRYLVRRGEQLARSEDRHRRVVHGLAPARKGA